MGRVWRSHGSSWPWLGVGWSDRKIKVVTIVSIVVGYPAAIAFGALITASGNGIGGDSPWPGAIGAAVGLPLLWFVIVAKR